MRKEFKYEQYLALFDDVLDAEYSEKTVTAYRTVGTVPADEKDQTPLALRSEEGVLRYEAKLTKAKLADLQYPARRKLVGNIGLSCNDSPESALDSVRKQVEKKIGQGLNAGLQEEDIISEILRYGEGRGRYIIKYNFTPESGQFSDFDNGHCNYHPYKGVDIEEYRDKNSVPIEINYSELATDAIRKDANRKEKNI